MAHRPFPHLVALLTTVLGLVLGMAAVGTAAPPSDPGPRAAGGTATSAVAEISGVVVDDSGHHPDDVLVQAVVDGEPVASALTYEGPDAAHGYFRLQVPPGRYDIEVSDEAGRYLTQTTHEDLEVGEGALFDLGEVQLVRPDQPGAIVGVVADDLGDHPDDVLVQAIEDGEPVASALTYEGPDTAHGYFNLQVPPGTYDLQVSDEAGRYLTQTPRVEISVRSGMTVDLGDVQLVRPDQPGVIVGVVADDLGGHPDDVLVQAVADGEPVASALTYEGRRVAHGFFRLHVPPGTYDIKVSDQAGRYLTTVPVEDVTVAPSRFVDLGTVRLTRRVRDNGAGGGYVPPPAPATPKATTPPSIAGSPKVDSVLIASPGTWDTPDLAFSFQWTVAGAAITGATGRTYTVRPGDLGKAVGVMVTARRSGYPDATASSEAVTALVGDAPGSLEAPVILGVAEPGSTLLVSEGEWDLDGLSFTYQWQRDGEAVPGATSSAYVVDEDDLGTTLTVLLTATRAGHQSGTVTSEPLVVPAVVEPEEPVGTVTRARLLDDEVRQGRRAELRLVVRRGDGQVAVGDYVVRVDGEPRVTGTLRRGEGGVDVVTLPRLDKGRHRVLVRFLGDRPALVPSTSEVVVLRVVPRRRG